MHWRFACQTRKSILCCHQEDRRPHCPMRLEVVDKTIMTKAVNYVVDMDIEKFFDTVDHKWMMKCLEYEDSRPGPTESSRAVLKAGVMEEGNIKRDKAHHREG